MNFEKIGALQIFYMVIGAVVFIALPIVISIVWTKKKKEKFTTVLVGAVTFFLFAMILEKPIQNILLFPNTMGLPEHGLSRFINSHPFLLTLLAGLFAGVFEETGRFIAFKTVLKKRRNRETSISYGIGHGGFEVILILGIIYVQNIVYSLMINSGTFGIVVEQVKSVAPQQLDEIGVLVSRLVNFSFTDLALAFVERIFAFLFHVGASILVFFACREKNKFYLYPLAILLHVALDFIVAFFNFQFWILEIIIASFGILTFCGAYFLLYKKASLKKSAELYANENIK